MDFFNFYKKLRWFINILTIFIFICLSVLLCVSLKKDYIFLVIISFFLSILFYLFIMALLYFIFILIKKQNRKIVFQFLKENEYNLIFIFIFLLFLVLLYHTYDKLNVSVEALEKYINYMWIIQGVSLTVFIFSYYFNISILKDEKNEIINKKLLYSKSLLNILSTNYKKNMNRKKFIFIMVIFSSIFSLYTTGQIIYKLNGKLVIFSFFLCCNSLALILFNLWDTFKYDMKKNNIYMIENDLKLTDEEEIIKYKYFFKDLFIPYYCLIIKNDILKKINEKFLLGKNILTKEQADKYHSELNKLVEDFQFKINEKELEERFITDPNFRKDTISIIENLINPPEKK